MLNLIQSTASFSPCGKYRWSLKRRIHKSSKTTIVFIGLNPSLGNSIENDATLVRLINFADCWGYGFLLVLNLFARISKDPTFLQLCCDPIGPENQFELETTIKKWSENQSFDLWLGWGEKGKYMNRNVEVLRMIQSFQVKRFNKFPYASMPYVIGTTKTGHPRHPLYASNKEVLRPFQLKNNTNY